MTEQPSGDSDAARRTAPAPTGATTALATPPARSPEDEPETKGHAKSTSPRHVTREKTVPEQLSEPNPPTSTSTSISTSKPTSTPTPTPTPTPIPQPQPEPQSRQQQPQDSPQGQPSPVVSPIGQCRAPEHPNKRQAGHSQLPPAPAPGPQFFRFATNHSQQNEPRQSYDPRHYQQHQQHQPSSSQHAMPSLPPLSPLFEPYPLQGANRDQFYGILGELDPYKATPKEFIHLLVNAAIRDAEIAKALYHLNSNRINHPDAWQPPVPPNVATRQHPSHPPNQPTPGAFAPTLESPNTHTHNSVSASAPTHASQAHPALPQAQQGENSRRTRRKRKRRGGATETEAGLTNSESGAENDLRVVMYWGPQQPLPPVYPTGPQY
ncbi:hypothetical protein F5X98DRAFT_260457 [Xylaria grammica]|nr:hypothetical protein F5X98DRAFT_260457 [Xylaria grammica]